MGLYIIILYINDITIDSIQIVTIIYLKMILKYIFLPHDASESSILQNKLNIFHNG